MMKTKTKMLYNKAESTFGVMVFFGMMLSLMLWIAFTQMLGPVTDATQDARSVSQLDCDNTSISQGTKATCIIVDYMTFGWSGAVISLIIGAAAGGLFYKMTKPKEK